MKLNSSIKLHKKHLQRLFQLIRIKISITIAQHEVRIIMQMH